MPMYQIPKLKKLLEAESGVMPVVLRFRQLKILSGDRCDYFGPTVRGKNPTRLQYA